MLVRVDRVQVAVREGAAGEGPVRAHLERWGEGIFAAGFSSADLPALARRLSDRGVRWEEGGGEVYIGGDQTPRLAGWPWPPGGAPATPAAARPRTPRGCSSTRRRCTACCWASAAPTWPGHGRGGRSWPGADLG